jgi:hypothetical protein
MNWDKFKAEIIKEVEEKIEKEKSKEKESERPILISGDICEAWYDKYKDSEIVFFSRYYQGKSWFVRNKGNIGNDYYDIKFPNYKLIQKANTKNKLVIVRNHNNALFFLLNHKGLIFDDMIGKWVWESCLVDKFLGFSRFPEILPGEKIEIEF